MRELDLVKQAKKGNTNALNQLCKVWYQRVFNIAYKYFSDREMAKDISQESFIKVQSKIGQLKDPAGFKVWLYRLVINLCHSEVRKSKSRMRTEENALSGSSYSYEDNYDRKDRAKMVMDALQKIPAEQRTVVILKEYEELKFKEIADMLDISENTAKSRMYYGLNALRKFFLTEQMKKEVYHD